MALATLGGWAFFVAAALYRIGMRWFGAGIALAAMAGWFTAVEGWPRLAGALLLTTGVLMLVSLALVWKHKVDPLGPPRNG